MTYSPSRRRRRCRRRNYIAVNYTLAAPTSNTEQAHDKRSRELVRRTGVAAKVAGGNGRLPRGWRRKKAAVSGARPESAGAPTSPAAVGRRACSGAPWGRERAATFEKWGGGSSARAREVVALGFPPGACRRPAGNSLLLIPICFSLGTWRMAWNETGRWNGRKSKYTHQASTIQALIKIASTGVLKKRKKKCQQGAHAAPFGMLHIPRVVSYQVCNFATVNTNTP
jgi:hypothetical protein